jgi:hypothetical protein
MRLEAELWLPQLLRETSRPNDLKNISDALCPALQSYRSAVIFTPAASKHHESIYLLV